MDIQPKSAIVTAEPGSQLGVSEWVTITQAMINHFSLATLDDDPMHADPQWAAEKGPFGKTVSYGFLTMSLLTHLLHDVLGDGPAREPDRGGYFLNFGFNRMRLVTPVPVDSRVRGRFRLAERSRDRAGRARLGIGVEIEIEGEARPALAGVWLVVWVPPANG
ncbi:MaoC/PaaZ C-terminal domain-containing protein [Sandaracinobacteroides sayramensis]|uniref:MaoC/PaaZ C-terminal domain-containing protein n=1 Tax=Sandaracinobacteroides sayramensis TaxID=2913411 RepID=UPI0021075AD3|nr:MaoC/PaaZ C-terminal domain-containing protein [Sandaracinobacteroides sayramensis]